MDIIHLNRLPRFVNVGENPRRIPPNSPWIAHRQWTACINYNFTSAGQGLKYSKPLEALQIGDYIAAYITGEGYVVIGKVISQSTRINKFLFDNFKLSDLDIDPKIIEHEYVTNQTVERLPFLKKMLFRNANDETKSEYVIGVEWVKFVTRENAYWRINSGLYASRQTQCSLENQPVTIKFIEEKFKMKFLVNT